MTQATFSSIGCGITVRIQLKDLSVEDRRSMLNQLLFDTETNPGQLLMTADERYELLAKLDRFCGWKKGA